MTTKKQKIRLVLVVPHIFINRDILPAVIFSPGNLALSLAKNLKQFDIDVTLFTPGPADTAVRNITADMTGFKQEVDNRGYDYLDLLKKHPFTFISLARQVQSEVIAKAFDMANNNKLDIIHIYTNEEDIALPFAKLCKKAVVFTHHDPFNFLIKYKSVFPKYKELQWISLSYSQRSAMPEETNWIANIYHGLDKNCLNPIKNPSNKYFAYLGRIIEPKGVHIAIEAVNIYNKKNNQSIKLKIAGKHYSEHTKDTYWTTKIKPYLNDNIEYVGHINSNSDKQLFLANAKALIVPSIFDEPFGMVTIESLACGTPVIGLDHGATPEIIKDEVSGKIVKYIDDVQASNEIAKNINIIDRIDRSKCRREFVDNFTDTKMVYEHSELYKKIAKV